MSQVTPPELKEKTRDETHQQEKTEEADPVHSPVTVEELRASILPVRRPDRPYADAKAEIRIPEAEEAIRATQQLQKNNSPWPVRGYDKRIEELKDMLSKSAPVEKFLPQFCMPATPEIYDISSQTMAFSHRHGVWVDVTGINDAAVIALHSTNLVSFTVSTLIELLDSDKKIACKRRLFLSEEDEKAGLLPLHSSIGIAICDVWIRKVGKFFELTWLMDADTNGERHFCEQHVDFIFYVCVGAVMGIISDYLRNLDKIVKEGKSVAEYNFWFRGRMVPVDREGDSFPKVPGAVSSQAEAKKGQVGQTSIALSYPPGPYSEDSVVQVKPEEFIQEVDAHWMSLCDSFKLRSIRQGIAEQVFTADKLLSFGATPAESVQKMHNMFQVVRKKMLPDLHPVLSFKGYTSEVAKSPTPRSIDKVSVVDKVLYGEAQMAVAKMYTDEQRTMATNFTDYMESLLTEKYELKSEAAEANVPADEPESVPELVPTPVNWICHEEFQTMDLPAVQALEEQKISVNSLLFNYTRDAAKLRTFLHTVCTADITAERVNTGMAYLNMAWTGQFNMVPGLAGEGVADGNQAELNSIREGLSSHYIHFLTGKESETVAIPEPSAGRSTGNPTKGFALMYASNKDNLMKILWFPLTISVRVAPFNSRVSAETGHASEMGTMKEIAGRLKVEIENVTFTRKDLTEMIRATLAMHEFDDDPQADLLFVCFYKAVPVKKIGNAAKVDTQVVAHLGSSYVDKLETFYPAPLSFYTMTDYLRDRRTTEYIDKTAGKKGNNKEIPGSLSDALKQMVGDKKKAEEIVRLYTVWRITANGKFG